MTAVFAIWGRDEVVRPETFPTVADVVPESPAESAGVRRGDKVVRIGGQDARDQQTQVNEIVLAPDQVKPVEIERDGVRQTLSMATGQGPGLPPGRSRLAAHPGGRGTAGSRDGARREPRGQGGAGCAATRSSGSTGGRLRARWS